MRQTLRQFLKARRLYSAFIRNCINGKTIARVSSVLDICESGIIGGAFIWNDTPKGTDFWVKIHIEWEANCETVR